MNSDMFEVLNYSAQLNHPVDFPEEGFLSWVNNLINEGGMKEAIIVIPNAANRYALSFYTNNEVQGNYEDYIVEDLIFYIDMNYRTIPHFNFRAITGHSAGGYGALRIAMRHPDVFRYTVGMSPGIFPEELVIVIADYVLLEQNLWGFEGPSPYNPADLFKFMTNGLYSCAAAWLPNPENPPYYVDLPFTYDEEGKAIINDELMAKWNRESLFNLVLENEKGIKKLKSFSFDCGINDDLMMYPSDLALHEMLDEMKVKHHFETYEGTHFSNLYDRLGKALVDLSNDFPEDE
jgi:S-formylglutathione hydrolase FrmB